ncbi:MAG: PKD domain-containing protein, partial [Acidobacteriota bacterium]
REEYQRGSLGGSRWTVSADGTVVTQDRNSRPALLYGDIDPYSVRLSGRLRMNQDNDYAGFAFGFEPGDTASETGDFLLLYWKKTNDNGAKKGLALVRFVGQPGSLWTPEGAANVEVLAKGATLGTVGWSANQSYEFTFELDARRIRVWVDGQLEIDVEDDDFGVGRFAFYNYSQQHSEYRDWIHHGWWGEEGSPVEVAVAFGDPGADTHSATLTWGDGGSDPATLWTDDGLGWAGGGHAYAADGSYTAQLCVDDDDGGSTCIDLPVRVDNAAPVVTAAAPTGWVAGSAISTVLATYVDPGAGDVHTATVDWGDGQSEAVAVKPTVAGSGEVEAGHAYAAAGTYTVDVCVTDDGGDSQCAQLTVEVAP